jgi:hypothetical protein
LYTNDVVDGLFKKEDVYGERECLMTYAKLWSLSGRYLIPIPQNEDISENEADLEKGGLEEYQHFIHYAYKTKEDDTLLKRLTTESLVFAVDSEDLVACAKDLLGYMILDHWRL